jgi:solute carrier family 45, member 1/2/4
MLGYLHTFSLRSLGSHLMLLFRSSCSRLPIPEYRPTASSRYPLSISCFTLPRAWATGHILFSMCMFSTFFIDSASSSIVLVSIVGVSWAISQWVPFALVSEEIARLQRPHHGSSGPGESVQYARAGVIMGLHNAAIASPQIAAALACSALFRLLQGIGVSDSLGWTLRASGLSALAAAWLSGGIDAVG